MSSWIPLYLVVECLDPRSSANLYIIVITHSDYQTENLLKFCLCNILFIGYSSLHYHASKTLQPQAISTTAQKKPKMPTSKGSTRRDRNREAVRKFRQKAKREEDEMQSLYHTNEEKIARLEVMADRLAAELSSSKRRWSKISVVHEQLLPFIEIRPDVTSLLIFCTVRTINYNLIQ